MSQVIDEVQRERDLNNELKACKDCERARGALDELQKKKDEQSLVPHGEVEALKKKLNDLRKEYNHKNARDEAKLRNEIDTSRIVVEKLKNEVENLSSERDRLKSDAEKRKILKQQKKEFEILQLQVITSIIKFNSHTLYH